MSTCMTMPRSLVVATGATPACPEAARRSPRLDGVLERNRHRELLDLAMVAAAALAVVGTLVAL
jgi:hypothetical protein